MANDPAFLFYPGDYLRDTQTLSEKTQVAYDRIMCEHMRNICISKQQLKFFTKKLNEDEVEELMYLLTEIDGGYQIAWIAESINKRRAYSESRRENRIKKTKKKNDNISKTYDSHMENEIENEIVIKKEGENKSENNGKIKKFQKPTMSELQLAFQNSGLRPDYAFEQAELFFNHYESNGWKIGKNHMKSWTHAVGNWVRRMSDFKSAKPTNKNDNDFYGNHARKLERELGL